jgi:hypothetical protein
MRINRLKFPLLLCLSVCVVSLARPSLAQAPSGAVTSPSFSGTNGLYDLTDVITNLTIDLVASDGTEVPWNLNVAVAQSVTGQITATTPGTIVTVMAEDGTFSNSATYTLKGAVKSSGDRLLFSPVLTLKSGAFLGGDPTYAEIDYQVSIAALFTIDSTTGAITSSRATGHGSEHLGDKHKSGLFNEMSLAPDQFTPVSWSTTLTLDSTGSAVKGNATVNLANGRSFPFNVKGTTKDGASKLTLTGTGTGRGTTLKVTMNSTNIVTITGRLLGQAVNITSP